eukprot:CAMPEP_0181319016 /NCGR_PEP_ID=MMETSP1101-20121128/17330_1 /TAXON_ID=46948 /ORGANISM="Rhodomonas abbreviata, Strain Caron Lab Isolate" /LENGTH=527 /DNA_ID=CAMNT_0023426555 /DNA_START=57 /DNA_END=1641 /DNA_ORIENTATION=-
MTGDSPVLLHCSAAFGHPDTKEKLSRKAKDELVSPKEETFHLYANAGKGVSKLGTRAKTMDFTETLRLLIDFELLYKHVSVTVSHSYQRACFVRNVEDGQLTFENYRYMMNSLAVILGELEESDLPEQVAPLPEHGGKHQRDGARFAGRRASMRVESDPVGGSAAAREAAHTGLGAPLHSQAHTGPQALFHSPKSAATTAASLCSLARTAIPQESAASSPTWAVSQFALDPHSDSARWIEQARAGRPGLSIEEYETMAKQQAEAFLAQQTEPVAHEVSAASIRKQMELERTRLGRMFASTIVYARQAEALERKASEREARHLRRTEERRQKVQQQLQAEAKAAAERVARAQVKAEETQQLAAEKASQRWEKIEQTSQKVVSQRRVEAEERALAVEKRRQARKKQLQAMKKVEEHRLKEVSKKAAILEEHRMEVYAKRMQERDNIKLRLNRIGREKEVVSELFQDYLRTGALQKPWGLVDLDGDALPSVLEIAAQKSKQDSAHASGSKQLLFPILGNQQGPRSKSSML